MYNCTNCGEEIEIIKGSIGFPYCKRCFRKIWKNDLDKYYNWLRKAYMIMPKDYKEKAKQHNGSEIALPYKE